MKKKSFMFAFLFFIILFPNFSQEVIKFDPVLFNGRWDILSPKTEMVTIEIVSKNTLVFFDYKNKAYYYFYYFENEMLYISNCGYICCIMIQDHNIILSLFPISGEIGIKKIILRKKSF